MSGATTTPSIPTSRADRAAARSNKRAAIEETAPPPPPPPPPRKRQRTAAAPRAPKRLTPSKRVNGRKTIPRKVVPAAGLQPTSAAYQNDLARMGIAPPAPPPPKAYVPLHLSKDWILFDPRRPWPKETLRRRDVHPVMERYMEYKKGVKRVVEVSTKEERNENGKKMGPAVMRLNTTSAWLVRFGVVFSRDVGPVVVEGGEGDRAEERVAVPDMRRETNRYKYDF